MGSVPVELVVLAGTELFNGTSAEAEHGAEHGLRIAEASVGWRQELP
ncbi:hypothetical protein ARTSIC4J27_3289 [Pseudarthrobacter siccitolerans]|uniref:Uncharacterized protein n=1 Tax=Pseudarthrobacter siccitolerans TaxID=861266 RepID=A0A024H6B4_9MICC|nr:hypothetical protein ARTSIC4J27_3289 [Pseudarthrobacter siccitolerans]